MRAAFLVALALAGCAGTGAEFAAPVPVGSDLAGEPCRAEPRRGQPRGEAPFLDISCGISSRTIAAAAQLGPQEGAPTPVDARAAFFARALAQSRPMLALGSRATCDAPQPVDLPGESGLLVARCTLKDGGWPYLAVALPEGPSLAYGEGQPGALPAIVATMRRGLPGGAARAPATLAPAAAKALDDRLQAMYPGVKVIGDSQGAYLDSIELARYYSTVGNDAASEQAFRRALELQTAALGPDHPGLGTTLTLLAIEISNQGRGEEADIYFRRAEPLVLRSPDPGEYPRYLSYLGRHAANMRQFERALAIARDTVQRRRDLIQQLGGGVDPGLETGGGGAVFGGSVLLQAELAHALMFASSMAVRTNDGTSAEAYATEARRIVDRTPGLPPWWQPQAIGQLGEALAARGDFRNAERLLASAAALRARIFTRGWPVAQGLLALGREQAEEGRFAAAIDNYRNAFRHVLSDKAVRTLDYDQIEPFLSAAEAQARSVPAAAAGLHAEMFAAAQMLREGAMGRAVTRTAERVADGDARIAGLVREQRETVRRRDRARIDIDAETNRQAQFRDAARLKRLNDELDGYTKRVDALDADIEKAAPGFGRLVSPRPIDLATVTAALRPREALLTFAVGSESAFAFLVDAKGVQAAKLSTDAGQLAEQVKALRQAFEIRNRNVAPFDAGLAHSLYKSLLGPFEAKLANVDRLYVVTSGALSSLPFGILVSAPPPAAAAGGDYSNVAWFARRVAIANPPSVAAFLQLRKLAARPAAPRALLAVANPEFDGAAAGKGLDALASACRTEGAVPSAMIRGLAPLPETADEVRRVALTLKADGDALLMGAAATAANLRSRQLDQYRVLYFATHGLLPGELRCQGQPGLALTAPRIDATDPADDGLLEAGEIASLRLDASLVVLSACNTAASGERLGGESLSGLAEAFFFAGARNLLVTHWQVPSAQTVALTTGMFERLGGDMRGGIAAALRDSQMALAANPATSHPFFWGAFVLQGDGAPVAAAGNPS
ncbi:MAG: CHAT domain-containing protein [Alphaproteobacteria bacterium]|nr:CHAT domain-containing protein [Alphaproteobacteria bacterium]